MVIYEIQNIGKGIINTLIVENLLLLLDTNAGLSFNTVKNYVDTWSLQKTVDSSYTLVDGDFNYLIFIDNGIVDITITVPDNLIDKFQVGFLRLGTGEVSFISTGTAILGSPGNKKRIAEQFGNAFVVKKGGTDNHNLNGSLKI